MFVLFAGVTCLNGGTLNEVTCVCACVGNWGGNTCDLCDGNVKLKETPSLLCSVGKALK